jgi:RimJ/RimL family protein N-acetyltransferase
MPDVSSRPIEFETPRLRVRVATDGDAGFIVALWSDPRVMRFVGFPTGIPTAGADVARRLRRRDGLSALLIAEEIETGHPIGQCLLGEPDADGVSQPDIKLMPARWGQGYGRELWAALIDQSFLRSTCAVVRGTPNVANAASIRMQEAAGMRRVRGGVSEFPESMRAYTESVPYYVYEITRDEWADRRERDKWLARRRSA